MYNECCKIVGVQPGADQDTIKAAFRKAAKELHPDLNASDKAHQYFIILQKAYTYLLNHPYQPSYNENSNSEKFTGSYQSRNSQSTSNQSRVQYGRKIYIRKSLNEILAQSIQARILFFLFHFLFLLIAAYLMYISIYDAFLVPLNREVQNNTSYVVILIGFLFGMALFLVFLLSGIRYLKRR